MIHLNLCVKGKTQVKVSFFVCIKLLHHHVVKKTIISPLNGFCTFIKSQLRIFLWVYFRVLCVCTMLLQLCPTLCDPMDCSPPGSSIHGILQARTFACSGLPCLPPGIFPTQGPNSCLLHLPALTGRFFTASATWKSPSIILICVSVLQYHSLDYSNHVRLFVTPQTVACQDPLSMEFFRQQYQNGWPFPSTGDLPGPEMEPRAPVLQVDSLSSEPAGKPSLSVSLSIHTHTHTHTHTHSVHTHTYICYIYIILI